MSTNATRPPIRFPGDVRWYDNLFLFFGVTLVAVFLGGYLACLAAVGTIYGLSKAPAERKFEEMKRKLDDWEGLPVRQGKKPS